MMFTGIGVNRFGGPEQLVEKQFPARKPGKGELLVRVEASGVSSADMMFREGVFPVPKKRLVLGYDCVGTVVSAGCEEGQSLVGKRIIVQTITGCHCDNIIVTAEKAVPVPADAPLNDLAALGLNYTTALSLLKIMGTGTVLFQGLSGGVGTALTDLAGRFPGLRIIGTANPDRVEYFQDRGIDCFSYRDPELTERLRESVPVGFDWIIDPFGGRRKKQFEGFLSPQGVIIGIGFSGGSFAGYLMNLLQYKTLALRGRSYRFYSEAAESRRNPLRTVENQREVIDLYRQGSLNPLISTGFPFREIQEAHRYFQTPGKLGKVVLIRDDKDWMTTG